MKKRVLSILLAMVMVLSMGTGALAAGTSGLRLNLTYSGNEICLDVNLTAETLTNGRIVVTYDADKVSVKNVQVGSTEWISSVNTDTAGQIGFAWVGSDLTADATCMVSVTFTEVSARSGAGAVYAATVMESYCDGAVVTLDTTEHSVVGKSTYVDTPTYVPPVTNTPSGSTETTENPDGSTTTVVENKDGTVTETVTTKEGTTATTVTNPDGEVVSMTAEVPAVESGESVTLPLEVEAAKTPAAAVPVEVKVPANVQDVTVEIPVEDVTPGSVVVLVHPDGTEEIVPKTQMTDDGVAITVDDSVVVKVVDNSKEFVDDNTWAADAITFVTSRELFNGTSTNTFSPNEQMSRAMLATVLWRMEGKEAGEGIDFSDVASGKWYSEAIGWASEKGIITGYGNSFGPDDNITREQMVTILYRLMGEPETNTTVSGTSSWAADAMAWAVEIGLIQGNGNGLNAKGTATRAEVATILMRFMNMNL